MKEDKIVKPISVSHAKKVIKERLPDLKLKTIEYLGGGSTSAFAVNNQFVVKFPKIEVEGQQYSDFIKLYEKEGKLNVLLSPIVRPHEIVIPLEKIEGLRENFKGPIFLYKYFVGKEVEKTKFNVKQQQKLAKLVGNFLSKLHSVNIHKAASLGLPKLTSASIERGWSEQYKYYKRNIFPLLSKTELEWYVNLYEKFLAKSKTMRPKVVLTHGDFGPENVLLPREFNRLQVIDFEDIGLGDAVGDFCVWYQHFGMEFINQMLANYSPIDKDFTTRIRFYSSRLPLIYFNLYKKSGNKGFLVFARKALKKIVKMEANA